MPSKLPIRPYWILAGALLLVLLIRLLTLDAYPLTDTTEARYGEMVRKMVELRDWVTPWYDYNVPFWGKPPLAFWLSAASAEALGMSEFSLRLPSLLLGIAMLALTGWMAWRQRGQQQAWVAMLVLASTPVFFVSAGAVFTDTALAFAITLAMVAFWQGMNTAGRGGAIWRYLFFVALGLGLLSKGPVVLVLAGLPILAWCLLCGESRRALFALPWTGGIALMLLIAVPWYVLAEQRTPGFLSYFLIGENFLRFIDPDWPGHLYGSVHTKPKGYIWLYWFTSTLPWSLFLLWALARKARRRDTAAPAAIAAPASGLASWRIYLACFALTPCVLFTMAGSVLATYVLPGIPALALCITELWPSAATQRDTRRFALAAAALPVLFALSLSLLSPILIPDKSQRDLLAHLPPDTPTIYFPKRPFSAQYYSNGQALVASDVSNLKTLLSENTNSYLVTQADELLPAEIKQHYTPIARVGRKKLFVLWGLTALTNNCCHCPGNPSNCKPSSHRRQSAVHPAQRRTANAGDATRRPTLVAETHLN